MAVAQPVIVDDLGKETRFIVPALPVEHGAVSGMTVIIHDHRRPFGVLGAHSRQLRRFSQDDVHFLQAIANLLAARGQGTRFWFTLPVADNSKPLRAAPPAAGSAIIREGPSP
jgi:signal transduction protein with GAF and PtsI domain